MIPTHEDYVSFTAEWESDPYGDEDASNGSESHVPLPEAEMVAPGVNEPSAAGEAVPADDVSSSAAAAHVESGHAGVETHTHPLVLPAADSDVPINATETSDNDTGPLPAPAEAVSEQPSWHSGQHTARSDSSVNMAKPATSPRTRHRHKAGKGLPHRKRTAKVPKPHLDLRTTL